MVPEDDRVIETYRGVLSVLTSILDFLSYIYIYIHTHTHIYIYIYIHTHIYIYIYVCVCVIK